MLTNCPENRLKYMARQRIFGLMRFGTVVGNTLAGSTVVSTTVALLFKKKRIMP